MNTPENIIVHHTAVSYDKNPAQFKATNAYHKEKGFPRSSLGYYVGYHYMIEKDGLVIQARSDKDIGAHTSQNNMNYSSIGICLTGNFDVELPTDAQIKSLQELINKKQGEYRIPNSKVVPHRVYATYKTCWGSLLPNDIITYLQDRMQNMNQGTPDQPSLWALETVAAAKNKGIMNNWDNCQHEITPKKIAYVFYNLGWLDVHPDEDKSPYKNRDMTEEEFMHALHKGRVF